MSPATCGEKSWVLINTETRDFYGTLFSYRTVLVYLFPLVATSSNSYYHCHSRVSMFRSSTLRRFPCLRCMLITNVFFILSGASIIIVYFIAVPHTIRHSAKKRSTGPKTNRRLLLRGHGSSQGAQAHIW